VSIAKDYLANRESPSFLHEQYCVTGGPKHSSQGIQSVLYDLVSPGRAAVGGKASDLYKPQGKVALYKVSPVSGFAHAASGSLAHAIGEHRTGLEQNPGLFRSRAGFKPQSYSLRLD
jgi:hypothetical protein